MKYAIQYEHMKDELVTGDPKTKWCFEEVKKGANKNKLELTDEEFRGLFALCRYGKDIGWIMNQMNIYKSTFTDALISYIAI